MKAALAKPAFVVVAEGAAPPEPVGLPPDEAGREVPDEVPEEEVAGAEDDAREVVAAAEPEEDEGALLIS